jgi:hypothetical protein
MQEEPSLSMSSIQPLNKLESNNLTNLEGVPSNGEVDLYSHYLLYEKSYEELVIY